MRKFLSTAAPPPWHYRFGSFKRITCSGLGLLRLYFCAPISSSLLGEVKRAHSNCKRPFSRFTCCSCLFRRSTSRFSLIFCNLVHTKKSVITVAEKTRMKMRKLLLFFLTHPSYF